jgi:hypothetical protein
VLTAVVTEADRQSRMHLLTGFIVISGAMELGIIVYQFFTML